MGQTVNLLASVYGGSNPSLPNSYNTFDKFSYNRVRMAKLSVYNTIDRSQLGGKFVPLIQSGVSNYKILASDLGKEYHPGDAIEITDTGEINAKFRPDEFSVSSEGLNIKTDYDRGVFKGSDGIYIASADSTINVSVSGIKVNRSNLVSRISGAGLKAVGEMIDVNSADDTIDVGMDGIRVNTSALSIPNAHSLAGSGLESVDSNTLYVKSANGTINVSSLGIKVNTSFLAGRYLRSDSNHGITVDTAPLAHAITGSGLVETNGLIGVNVNTATGIIVNDNRLYLNAGYGLHTTNNTVKVKAADGTIDVSSSGIKVNTGSGLFTLPDGLSVHYYTVGKGLFEGSGNIRHASGDYFYASATVLAGRGLIATGDWDAELNVQPADGFIKVGSEGVGLNYHNLLSSLTNEYGGSANIKSAGSYLYTAIGDGLRCGSNSAIYVKSANSTIDVSSSGIRVNPGYSLSSTSVGLEVNPSNDTLVVDSGGVSVNTSYLAGYGLSSVSNSLEVKPADDTIYVSSAGIGVNRSALSIPTALSLAGNGLGYYDNNTKLYIRSSNNTISVSDWGISVYYGSGLTTDSVSGALIPDAGYGLETNTYGLSAKSANNSIGVSEAGITVNAHSLAGYGLSAFSNGIVLHVQPADNTITVGPDGIKVNKSALSIPTASSLVGSGLTSKGSYLYVRSADGSIGVGVDGIKVNAASGLETTSSGLYVKSADNTITVGQDGIKVNTLEPLVGLGLEWSGAQALYVKSADSTIEVSDSGIRVHTSQLAGYGLSAISNGLYVHSADGTIGVTSSGIGVNVTSGGGLLTGANGLYIDSGQLAGNGLAYYSEQNNVKLYVKSADNTINVSSEGIKVAEGFGLPDYSSAVTATQNTEYTADANCWLYMQVYSWSNSSGGSVNKSIVIDGVTVAYLSSFWYSVPSIMVPCKKGSVYQFKNSQTGEGSYTFKVYKCLK